LVGRNGAGLDLYHTQQKSNIIYRFILYGPGFFQKGANKAEFCNQVLIIIYLCFETKNYGKRSH
jgi:hypothetical protein